MAELLKDAFDARVVREIGRALQRAHAPFDADAFTRDATRGLTSLELTARGTHVALAMRRHLPDDVERALDVVAGALGPPLARTEGNGMTVFRYLPHATFVARFGLGHFAVSMRAIHAITQRFTGEFAIRPFLEHHELQTLAVLDTWTRDPSVHVRRLVSEGTRPRLPWAPRLRAFMRDPSPVLALLERLKDDDERYVARSVANNLGDIAKDHRALAIDVCARWMRDAPPNRAWLVRHALRVPVKAGDRAALAVIGFDRAPSLEVTRVRATPRRVMIGQSARVAFTIRSTARASQELLVDYAVDYVKKSGATSTKVFKLTKTTLAPGAEVALEVKLAFADLSTRTHHPGPHAVSLRVNGADFPLTVIDLRR